MDHFADRLIARCEKLGSFACVGLDPRPGWEPRELASAPDPALAFSLALVDIARGRVPAVKPQLAFLEDDPALAETIALAASPELLVVADAKRGDIGTTAEAYAERWLGEASPFDALTVNPFLGADSLEPFVKTAAKNGRGIFVLVRTSNPGAADLQDLELESGGRVWERLAKMVDELGRPHVGESGYSCVGAVVGATVPKDVVARLRELMPRSIFLMPGLGAQGGDIGSVKVALDARGRGVLAPSSRGLAYPWRGKGDGAFPAPDDWIARISSAIDALDRELARARG